MHFDTNMAAPVLGLGSGLGVCASGLCRTERWVGNGHQGPLCALLPLQGLGLVKGCKHRHQRLKQRSLVRMSVDVDDSATEGSTSTDEIIKEATEELQRELDPRRGLEERYAVINTGKFECRSCGYVYDTEKGDSNYPIPGGIPFSKLPVDWRCPTCGASQSYFQSKGVEVAGFAQNQSYGLGANSLTQGQKSLLIYGSLVGFFALFLAGYLLQ